MTGKHETACAGHADLGQKEAESEGNSRARSRERRAAQTYGRPQSRRSRSTAKGEVSVEGERSQQVP
jgi:hypothetical protein